MKLSLAHFFLLYVTVFVAVLLACWLAFLRRCAKRSRKGRRRFTCQTCYNSFPERVPYRKPRCPECGANYELRTERTI